MVNNLFKRKLQCPPVSIIIPVYNNSRYLRECLDSVLAQTLKEVEIIVINDGSTDIATVNILHDYKRNCDKIKLVNKNNTGYGHSLNLGMAMAKGEYIGIVESDDFIHEKMYEILYKTAKYGDLDFARSDFAYFIDYQDKRLYQRKSIIPDGKKYFKLYSIWDNKEFFHMPIFNQTGIYKTKFLRRNKIRFNETPGAAYQDNGFFFQILMFCEKMAAVDACFYFLRRDNISSSVNCASMTNAIFEEYAFIKKIIEDNPDRKKDVMAGFQLRKFKSYLFHLQRVNEYSKKSFLDRFADEFVQDKQSGELDISLFTKKEAQLLTDLLEDRNRFFENGGHWIRKEYFTKQKTAERIKPHTESDNKKMVKPEEIFKISCQLPLLRFGVHTARMNIQFSFQKHIITHIRNWMQKFLRAVS